MALLAELLFHLSGLVTNLVEKYDILKKYSIVYYSMGGAIKNTSSSYGKKRQFLVYSLYSIVTFL